MTSTNGVTSKDDEDPDRVCRESRRYLTEENLRICRESCRVSVYSWRISSELRELVELGCHDNLPEYVLGRAMYPLRSRQQTRHR